MYHGAPKSLYTGLALSDRHFLAASHVTSLTAPDELPYLTVQFTFDTLTGWGQPLVYEEDAVTAYAPGTPPIALTRTGLLFDAVTGRCLDRTGPCVTTHVNALTPYKDGFIIAGDDRCFRAGPPGRMTQVQNPFHLAMPAPTAPLPDLIAWGQRMQRVLAIVATASGDVVIGGANGFLTRMSASGFTHLNLGLHAHVTWLDKGDCDIRPHACRALNKRPRPQIHNFNKRGTPVPPERLRAGRDAATRSIMRAWLP